MLNNFSRVLFSPCCCCFSCCNGCSGERVLGVTNCCTGVTEGRTIPYTNMSRVTGTTVLGTSTSRRRCCCCCCCCCWPWWNWNGCQDGSWDGCWNGGGGWRPRPLSIVSPEQDAVYSSLESISGMGCAGSTVVVRIDDTITLTTVVANDGTWSIDLPCALSYGEHTVVAEITEPAQCSGVVASTFFINCPRPPHCCR